MDETPDIEPGYAIKLVKEYLAGNWLKSTTETISLKVISRLYLCEDLTNSCVPSSVLIRLLGGKVIDEDDPLKQYNEGTESIVFFMHGHLGYGPKLYGVFDGGRLEEFIPSRTLNNQDLEDPSIRMQIARKLARFHSMKLPVSKKQHPSFEVMLSTFQLSQNPDHRQEFSRRSKLIGDDSSWTSMLNIPDEIEWIRQTLEQVGGRQALSTNDMGRKNCLIRDVPDALGEIVTLIDYEIGGTNWRGYDIGCHLAMRSFDFHMPDLKSGLGFPDETLRREFITEYLSYMDTHDIYDRFDKDRLDSCDHLLMEADFMVLIWPISWLLHVMMPKTNDVYSDDAAILRSNVSSVYMYHTQAQFLVVWKNIGRLLSRTQETLFGSPW